MSSINCDIFIHGVLDQGQEVWTKESSNISTYYTKFYTQNYKHDVFICETPLADNPLSCCFYTFVIGNDKGYVSANIGRDGSYFAITIQIEKYHTTNVKLLYALIKEVFETIIVNKVLTKTSSGYRYAVRRLPEAEKVLNIAYDRLLKGLAALNFEQNNRASGHSVKEISSKDLYLYSSEQLSNHVGTLNISSVFKSENEKNTEVVIARLNNDFAQRLQQQNEASNRRINEITREKDEKISSLERRISSLNDDKRTLENDKQALENKKRALENEINSIKDNASNSLNSFRSFLEHGGLTQLQQFCEEGKKKSGGGKPGPTDSVPQGPKGPQEPPWWKKYIRNRFVLGSGLVIIVGLLLWLSKPGKSSTGVVITPDTITVDTTFQNNHSGIVNGKYQIDIKNLSDSVLSVGKQYGLGLIGDSVNLHDLKWIITGAVNAESVEQEINPNPTNDGAFSLSVSNSGRQIVITCCDNNGKTIATRKISVK